MEAELLGEIIPFGFKAIADPGFGEQIIGS